MTASAARARAVLELLFGAFLWGFSFIAGRWALTGPDASWAIALRMALVVAISLPVFLFSPPLRRRLHWAGCRLALAPGLLLGATIVLQVQGLHYTSVTKNAFITCLYVVFVPILDWIVTRNAIGRMQACLVLLALLGTGLLSSFVAGDWNVGDVLTLACAVTSAAHIVLIERVAPRIDSPFVFNGFQSFWAGVLALVAALVAAPPLPWPFPPLAWVGILTLVVVTLVAFLIQIRSQRVLPSSLVSVLFLLESPFAAIFAYFIFRERLEPLQWLGAALILGAAAGTVWHHRIPAPATEPLLYPTRD